jgi:very-short-patch-repair endonuclease
LRIKGGSKVYKEYSDKLISLQEGLDFNCLEAATQILLKNLLLNTNELTNEEQRYVKNNSSVDFVIYHKLNKQPVLIIEVDGFASHENNPVQLARDLLKNSILSKYTLPLIRFKTTGSGEKEGLRSKLNEVIRKMFLH